VCEIPGKLGADDPVSAREQLHQRARPDSVPAARRMVARFLARLDVPTARSGDIQLAVTEACANVVRHAYPGGQGDVLCECEATADEILIRVSDWGIGSDQPSVQPGLGLGIPLIERLSDYATQTHSHGVTLVQMRFARSGVLAEPCSPDSAGRPIVPAVHGGRSDR
jgi:anti-sigma regulatory factor (Ser/Thr protein kinase)